MKKYHLILFAAAWLAVFLSLPASGQSLTVEAPAVVTVSEAFRVVYTADGKTSAFHGPDFTGFNVLAGPSQSSMSSTQIINGKVSHTVEISYTYVVQPTGKGKFTIAAATATVNNKDVASRSLNIEVVDDGAPAQGGGQGSQAGGGNGGGQSASSARQGGQQSGDIQLKLILNKSKVVKGEPVTATLKLYSRANISGFEDASFPTFNGFWSQEIEAPSNISFSRETLNGTVYDAALLRKWMLLPQQSGEITIDPAELVCGVQVATQSNSRSIFDGFFETYQTVRKRVSTSPIKVVVSPLPAGAPASFTGGVGKFSMDVKLSKDSLTAHEAASMTVTISGTGNMNLIEAPKISFPADFEVYDVKRTENVNAGAGGFSGSKTFEFPFIPRSHGEFTIPSVQFTYYDIKDNKYVTLSSMPFTFKVGAGKGGDAVVVARSGKQSVRTLGEDIRFIRTALPSLKKDVPAMIASVWLYIVLALIAASYFIVSYCFRSLIRKRADVAGARNRKAKSVAKKRLKNAGAFLKENLYSAFYEELHKAIVGYISDKFRLPNVDLNKETIEETLRGKGRDEETIKRLIAVIDACEYARYAPSTGVDAMEKHYRDALDVISEIENG